MPGMEVFLNGGNSPMITSSSLDGVQIYSLDHHHELIIRQIDRACIGLRKRTLKGAFLKAFVEYPETTLIPEKKFETISASIEKHIHITGKGI